MALALSPPPLPSSSTWATSTTARFIVAFVLWKRWHGNYIRFGAVPPVSPETHSQWLDACLLDDKIYSIKPHVNAVPHAYISLILTLALSFTRTTFEIHLMKRSTSALHRYQIHTYKHARHWNITMVLFDGWRVNWKHHTPLLYIYALNTNSTKATIELKIAHGSQQYTLSIFRLLAFNSEYYTFLGSTEHKSIVSCLSFFLPSSLHSRRLFSSFIFLYS